MRTDIIFQITPIDRNSTQHCFGYPWMQRSIFDFASQGKSLEYIDLTDEALVTELVKREDVDASVSLGPPEAGVKDPAGDLGEGGCKRLKLEVECPICSKDLSHVDIQERIAHVDQCEAADVCCPVCSKSIDGETVEERVRHVEKCLRGLLVDVAGDKRETKVVKPTEARKEDRPNVYVNTLAVKTVAAEDKVIRVPLTIRRRLTKRKGIPAVKVLTFPVSPGEKYKVSVDAFNYSAQSDVAEYFLTHFHGDHYGGISKNWCYERVFEGEYIDDAKYRKIIYCTEITGKLLTLRFSIDPRFIEPLKFDVTYMIRNYTDQTTNAVTGVEDTTPGLYVTPITANHCPGAAIFLFMSVSESGAKTYILHCGDFRVNKEILTHPKLKPFLLHNKAEGLILDKVYLDTTYMNPEYNFPKQELVCDAIANMFDNLTIEQQQLKVSLSLFTTWFGNLTQSRITDFLRPSMKKKKFLILVGTYLIGKENLAIAILKKLGNCPIYVSNIKSRGDKLQILKTYNHEFLDLVLVVEDNPSINSTQCVIHLVPMQIVGNVGEMSRYFNENKYFEKFERCVGLRPTGWTFLRGGQRGSNSHDTINLEDLFKVMKVDPIFTYMDHILPQAKPITNGTSKRLNDSLYRIYTLPYSEHSSFRELSYFCIMLQIGKIIPTVNIENGESIRRMEDTIKVWQLAATRCFKGGEFDISLDDF